MNSLIKVTIGVAIGVVGYWLVDNYSSTNHSAEKQLVVEKEIAKRIEVNNADDLTKSSGSEKVSRVELEDEVESLRQQVELKEQELTAVSVENQRLKQVLNNQNTTPSNNNSDEHTKTKSETGSDRLEGVPESHHSLLSRPASMPKSTYELHDELVGEEEDVSWATMKEQQINHYLSTHKDSSKYVVHRVECRSTLCEIIGTKYPSEEDVWAEVSGQMRNQAWWEFTGTHTSSSIDDVGNHIFVTLLRRNKTGTI